MALRLGKTVRELRAQVDSAELMEWAAFLSLEGKEGDDRISDPVTMEHALKSFAHVHNSRL